jgi:hypothetical protein
VEITPGTLSKSASVHQKHPAANVATASPFFGALAACCAADADPTPTKAPLSQLYPPARASATTRIHRCARIVTTSRE